jgi:hypothetical protein
MIPPFPFHNEKLASEFQFLPPDLIFSHITGSATGRANLVW